MYLVMTNFKVTNDLKSKIAESLQLELSPTSYDGESTLQLGENLKIEKEDSVVISADARLLRFVHKIVPLENVYVFQEEKTTPLTDLTVRILRPSHNLEKLFESREFSPKNLDSL